MVNGCLGETTIKPYLGHHSFSNVRKIFYVIESLLKLLEAVEKINKKMLEENYMLTTSIAYGQFKYENRLECVGIEKNPIFGNAYVSAFLDNENGEPKIKPGQCRIVEENLPDEINERLKNVNNSRILNKITKKDKHYYFYWMINTANEIEQYSTAIDLTYKGMLKALKGERVGCCNRENDI